MKEKDENLLTGKVITTIGDEEGQREATETKVKRQPLEKLTEIQFAWK